MVPNAMPLSLFGASRFSRRSLAVNVLDADGRSVFGFSIPVAMRRYPVFSLETAGCWAYVTHVSDDPG